MSDPRVDQRIGDVDEEVENDDGRRHDDRDADRQGIVAVERRFDEIAPEAGMPKIVSTTTDPVVSAAAAGPR